MRLNGLLAEQRYDPEIATRISQYEMAFKMQTSVPELTDFKQESQATLDLYGIKQPGDGSFASNLTAAMPSLCALTATAVATAPMKANWPATPCAGQGAER